MSTLRKLTWPLGFTPSANAYNGDVNGLVVAANLTFDESGIVRSSKGTKIESSGPFSAQGNEIYSTVFDLATLINNSFPGRAKVRYVGLSNGTVVRNYGDSFKALNAFELQLMDSQEGSNGIYAFGNAFGHTLLFSGSAKFKDRGDLQHKLGIKAADNEPYVTVNVPPLGRADDPNASNFYDNWDDAAVEGTAYAKAGLDYITVNTVALTDFARAIIQRGIKTSSNLDLNVLLPDGVGTSEDLFLYNLRLQFSDKFIKVRVEYILATGPDVENYYWHEWTNRISPNISLDVNAFDFIPFDMPQSEIDSLAALNTGVTFVSSIREGQDTWTPLTCKRGDFNRVGSDDSLSWSTVKGIRITYYTTEPMQVLFNEARFVGGSTGQLTGVFSYLQQDFRNTGSYIELGMPSPQTTEFTVFSASTTVHPNIPDPQANGYKIYRVSNATDGFYVVKTVEKQRVDSWANSASPSTVTSEAHGLTNGQAIAVRDGYGKWEGVNGSWIVNVLNGNQFTVNVDTSTFGPMLGDLSFVSTATFIDNVTDAEALYGGSINRLDRNKSLLPDDIIGMIAPYFGRVIYLTTKIIVPSEQLDPSRYDRRYIIENAADTGEINLFIVQISERVILVGTTKGFYSLVGTGTIVNNAIDFKLDTLGEIQPPVSNAHIVYNSILYYLAADGWRFINGSSNGLLSEALRLQFPPWSEARFGYPAYRIIPANGSKISAVTVGSKAYFAMDQDTLGRSLLVYDFVTSRWEYRRNETSANNPYAMFVEEDGVILFTTEAGGDKNLHQLEVGNSYNGDAVTQKIELQTVFDDNGLPNNRKDALTLFIDADSGNATLNITLSGLRDDNSLSDQAAVQVFNGRKRLGFDCSNMSPCKSFRLSITGNVTTFKLYEYSVELQERPIQVNYLRIPPNNWGIAGRKRVPEIPMLIDTLGNTVSFTPILDNTTKPSFNFTRTDKDVYHHLFNEEQAAYVIGGFLKTITAGGVFEFYDLITPREVEPLPDPLAYKHIPLTNLGNASRKRFIQFAFVINTFGQNVTFTPSIDGTNFPPVLYNTTRRQTVIYTFTTAAVGIDIGGILDSNTDNQKFEYFGIDLGECISEKLPAVARYFKVPCNNFGTADKKRIRTIPLVIDTRGGTVTFTPSVDGVQFPSSTFVTNDKRTVLHYFTTDAFGIDYCGVLTSTTEFEFYGMGSVDEAKVEVLPIGKLYDQIGPFELKRFGRIYKARVRIVPEGTAVSYNLIIDCQSVATGTWQTDPNCEQILDISFPKFIMGEIVRLELNSSTVFHRLYAELLVRLTGNDTDNRWLKLA